MWQFCGEIMLYDNTTLFMEHISRDSILSFFHV